MIRAKKGDQGYWDEWIGYRKKRLADMWEKCQSPAGDPTYAPQYMFELAKNHWHLMFCLYSRGDSINDMVPLFAPMLDAWEESERLGRHVWSTEQKARRHSWALNFDHYIVSFWLVGLALALELPDDLWNRMVALIGNEGEDILLDRVIASRSPGRRIGTQLCFTRPYERLLTTINAPRPEQGQMLLEFVKHWYVELAQISKGASVDQPAPSPYPYWHKFGDRDFEDGTYFGRWCVEAVAVVKVFGVDDSLCLGHENYPANLLHQEIRSEPNHSIRTEKGGWYRKLLGL